MKEEEFKVGDWVVGKEGQFSENHFWYTPFQIAKLVSVRDDSDEYYCYNASGNNNYLSNFRHCKFYEIPDYTPSLDTYSYLTPILKELNIK